MRKGDKFEQDYSAKTHRVYLPVLISSQILRSLNAGQIDVAGLSKNNQTWVLRLFELKYSQYPGKAQWKRLLLAQDYLSKILEVETKLEVKFCQKDEP